MEDRSNGQAIISYAAPEDGPLKRAVIRLVELASGQRLLLRRYRQAREQVGGEGDIWSLALRSLDITPVFDPARLAAIPRTGPLLVVANHPFGVVDGLMICDLVAKVRKDFKVVAMSTLNRIPEVRAHVLPINFAGTREAMTTSARSRAAARATLAGGGCLIIFPAGGISTARRPFGPAIDGPWHPFVGKLAIATRATVLPVHFAGQNSDLFQVASWISLTLRLSLLLREAIRLIGRELTVRIGDPLPFAALPPLKAEELTLHLRAVTYGLAEDEVRRPGSPAARPSAGRARRASRFRSVPAGYGFRRHARPARPASESPSHP